MNTFKDKYFLFILFMYIYERERGVQAIPDINTTHNNLSCVCPPPCNPLAPPLDWPGDRHSWRYPGITPLYVPSTINLIKDSEPIAIIFINLGNLLRIDHSYLYVCLLIYEIYNNYMFTCVYLYLHLDTQNKFLSGKI